MPTFRYRGAHCCPQEKSQENPCEQGTLVPTKHKHFLCTQWCAVPTQAHIMPQATRMLLALSTLKTQHNLLSFLSHPPPFFSPVEAFDFSPNVHILSLKGPLFPLKLAMTSFWLSILCAFQMVSTFFHQDALQRKGEKTIICVSRSTEKKAYQR